MYRVDRKDIVEKLADVPQSSIGAPCPMILAGENHLHLAYLMENTPPDWDGSTIRSVGETSPHEPIALVEFKHAYAHMFGPPNDEAFPGHPLASRGLEHYAVHEVHNSSWIRQLCKMNSVHPFHRDEAFSTFRHFIFAFHDTTFECIAEDFTITVHKGSLTGILSQTLPRRPG